MDSRAPRARAKVACLALAIGLVATIGCTTTVQSPPSDPYVYAGSVPADVYYQPRAAWRGRTVYWWQGHWYYPSNQGWYYLREEPAELRPYRRGVVQAPPAYGYPQPGPYGAPPPVPPPLPAPR